MLANGCSTKLELGKQLGMEPPFKSVFDAHTVVSEFSVIHCLAIEKRFGNVRQEN